MSAVPGADAEEDVAEEDEGAGDERSEREDGDALAHGPLPGVLVEAAELHDDDDGDGKEAHDEGVVPVVRRTERKCVSVCRPTTATD